MKSVMWKKKMKRKKTKESEKMEIPTNKWKNSKMVRKITKEIYGKNETEWKDEEETKWKINVSGKKCMKKRGKKVKRIK